jgi:hypothetical protein
VNPIIDPPVADEREVIIDEDISVNIVLTGSDVDGDTLTCIVVSNPSYGHLSGKAPDVTYTPKTDFHGSDSFTFQVSDGKLDSKVAVVRITVKPVNDVPTADEQSVTTDEDVPIAIALTGNDIDEDALTYIVVSEPANGSLYGEAPSVTYKPNTDFNGSDSFTFRVNDGTLDSKAETVSIAVNPDVTTMARLDKSGTRFDQITGQFYMMVTWTNIGMDMFSGPLQMVIQNVSPPSVTVANADGATLDGKPYYDYSNLVADGKLSPGEKSGEKRLIFEGPSRVRFTFDVSCRASIKGARSIAPFAGRARKIHIVVEFLSDRPGVSALGQNYPNPFNPDTWIPYELSQSGHVKISIYSIQGNLVRMFDLGYQEIGQHFSKDEAAYWDGRNDFGEKVADGVYFYQIHAGRFHAVRKMVITRE